MSHFFYKLIHLSSKTKIIIIGIIVLTGIGSYFTTDLYNKKQAEKRLLKAQEEARILKEKEAAMRGFISGTVECEDRCPEMVVIISKNGKTIAKPAVVKGKYKTPIKAGTYDLNTGAPGYEAVKKEGIIVLGQKTTVENLKLVKIKKPVEPAPTQESEKSNTSEQSQNEEISTEKETQQQTTDQIPPIYLEDYNPCKGNEPVNELACLVITYRQYNNLSYLYKSSSLMTSAQKHAEWMNENKSLTHSGSYTEIIAKANCSLCAYIAWKGSPDHNAHLLNKYYTKMGIGISGEYYVIMFL